MNNQRPKTIFVTSDLHINAFYSDAKRYQKKIEQGISSHDTTVLLGDIFEFKYNLNSLDEQLASAKEWLTKLLKENSTKEIHYVLGNHDACREFWEILEQIAEENSNFKIHNDHVILGKTLFSHGDVAMLPPNMKPKPGENRIHNYADIHKEGVPKLVHSILNIPGPQGSGIYNYREPQIFNSLIAHYQDTLNQKGIADIVFGHIHKPQGIINFLREFLNIKAYFHSSGPAVLGCKNLMLSIEQNAAGNNINVTSYSPNPTKPLEEESIRDELQKARSSQKQL